MSNLFKKAKPPPEREDPEPMVPDEDRLKIAARKRAAKRRGGRASTVMSEDRLGP